MHDSQHNFSNISDNQLSFYHRNYKKIEIAIKSTFSRYHFFDSKKNHSSFIEAKVLLDNVKHWSQLRWSLNNEKIMRRLNYSEITDSQRLIKHKKNDLNKSISHLKLFKNIPCYPVERWMHPSKGGPDWHDWKNEENGRLSIDNKFDDSPCSKEFKLKNKPGKNIKGYWLWGGYLIHHFGHLISDHLTRVIEYLSIEQYYPEESFRLTGIVFSLDLKKGLPSEYEKLLNDIIIYLTEKKFQLMFIDQSVIIENLIVAKQGEQRDIGMANKCLPGKYYQAYLQENQTKNRLNVIEKSLKLYISRAGLKDSSAKFLGHEYIENYIENQGYLVIRPETIDIKTQLKIISQAKIIIADEGSSLHAIQLLGTMRGSLTILSRYLNSSMRLNGINSRLTKSINIIPITAGMIVTKNAAESLSLIDFKKLEEHFSSPINKPEFKYFCALQLNLCQEYWKLTGYSARALKIQFNPRIAANMKSFYCNLLERQKNNRLRESIN